MKFSPGCKCCGPAPCNGTLCMTLTSSAAGNPPLPGVTLTVTDSTGAAAGSCKTDSAGKCCIAISKADTYSITWPGNPTPVKQAVQCNATTNLTMIASNFRSVSFSILVCGGNCCPTPQLPATLTVSGGVDITLVFTDCNQQTVQMPKAPILVSWSASADGHQTFNSDNTQAGPPGIALALLPGQCAPNFYRICAPTLGCTESSPCTINATLDNSVIWGTVAGKTLALPLVTNPGQWELDNINIGPGNFAKLVIEITVICPGAPLPATASWTTIGGGNWSSSNPGGLITPHVCTVSGSAKLCSGAQCGTLTFTE